VAETIEWTRGLMGAVAEEFIASVDGDPARTVRALAEMGRVFDALCATYLAGYTDARETLSSWYTQVGTDLVSYLVSGAPVEPSVVNSQARALNVEPHQDFRAVAVKQTTGAGAHAWESARRRVAAVLKRQDQQQSILVLERNGILLAVVPVGEEPETLTGRLTALLADAELRRVLYISTGEPVSELSASGRSCRQALSALEIADYRGYRGRVTQCTEVILEVLLTHNPWVAKRIMESRLGEVMEKPHLLETLRAYVDCDMSLQHTAEELYVHPNTVAYRLRQITALTGRDMRKISDLSELTVGLAALDVVAMRHDHHKGKDLRALLLADA
jgi:sugar diacid utilization regulator